MANSDAGDDTSDSDYSAPCVFCGRSDVEPSEVGETYIKDGLTVHQYCLYFSSGLCQNGPTEEGISGFLIPDIYKEVKRARTKLNCIGCKKRGGFVGCSFIRCRKAGHVPCLRKVGFLFQFYDRFEAFCPKHRPTQDLLDSTTSYPGDQSQCCICLNKIECEPTFDTLYCPSCKMFYHRDCLQRQAWSSGRWFFRCPVCNSQEEFIDEMLRMGIDIPIRDAQWEESGRFRDLYELKRLCQVGVCECPEGRSYFTGIGQFRMRKCTTCGQCIGHVACTRGQPSRCGDCIIPSNQTPSNRNASTPCTCSVCIARGGINGEGTRETEKGNVTMTTDKKTDLFSGQSEMKSLNPDSSRIVTDEGSESPVIPAASNTVTPDLFSSCGKGPTIEENQTMTQPCQATTHVKRFLKFSDEPHPPHACTTPFFTNTKRRNLRKRSSVAVTVPKDNPKKLHSELSSDSDSIPFSKGNPKKLHRYPSSDSDGISLCNTPGEKTYSDDSSTSSLYYTPVGHNKNNHFEFPSSSSVCKELAVVVERIPMHKINTDAKSNRSRSSSRSSGSPRNYISPLLCALYKETKKS